MTLTSSVLFLTAVVSLGLSGGADAYCKQAKGFYVMTDNNCMPAGCTPASCQYTPCHSWSIQHADGTETAIDRLAGAAQFNGAKGKKLEQIYEWEAFAFGNGNGLYITATSCPQKYGYTCEKMTRVNKSKPGVSKVYYTCGSVTVPA